MNAGLGLHRCCSPYTPRHKKDSVQNDLFLMSLPPYVHTYRKTIRRPKRFASDVQPSALFVELEDAATSAAAEATAAGAGSGTTHHSSAGGDERPRSAAAGGFWFGLDTRHVEDAPGLAVIKRHPGGLEPTKRRPLQSQLQVRYNRMSCYVRQVLELRCDAAAVLYARSWHIDF